MEISCDNGILSAVEKGKKTTSGVPETRPFFSRPRHSGVSSRLCLLSRDVSLPCKRRLIIIFTHWLVYVSAYSWDDGVHRDTSHGASDANNYSSTFAETTRRVAIPLHVDTNADRKRSHGKKGGVKGFLTDGDFFDTISLRASLRIRALSCYPLSPTKLC